MKIAVGRSTKMMCSGILLSLCWFVFEACDCDETKEQNFPGFWVACIANKPTLMTYNGDTPVIVSSDPAGNFNPAQFDCTNPNSPNYKGSQTPTFPTSSPAGPGGFKRTAHDATGSGLAYLPQRLRELPFMPPLPPSATPAVCDSTFPDVLRPIHTDALVARFSTCPFAIKATIPVPTRPLQVAITPDGSTALVTSFDNAISFINLATNQVSSTLTTDPSINPHGLAISSDGTRAYVTSFSPSNPVVIVIDLSSKKIIATVPTITYAQGATLSPDNSQLWITSPLASSLSIIDTLTNTEVSARAVGQTTDVAFNSTGTHAYITSAPNKVVELDTATFQVLNTYTVGSGPTDIVMSYGDAFLVVNNSTDGSVSVIDLIQNVVKTTKVGANPTGIAWVY
jgi:DNA-binding beta-propeller fold protein YncE